MTQGLQENENRDPSSEKAAHTPALLSLFCDDMVPPENIRHAPVVRLVRGETWTFATNGALALLLRGADHGYGERPECKFQVEKFFEQFAILPMAKHVVSLAVMAKFIAGVAEGSASLWKADAQAIGDRPCEKCEGKNTVECKSCRGKGTHQCPSCDDEHDCRRCDGRGNYPCGCTRPVFSIDDVDVREFTFGGICFDARILHETLRHIVLRWDIAQVGVIPDPREPPIGMLVILHDEFRVILMSLRTREDVRAKAPEYLPRIEATP